MKKLNQSPEKEIVNQTRYTTIHFLANKTKTFHKILKVR